MTEFEKEIRNFVIDIDEKSTDEIVNFITDLFSRYKNENFEDDGICITMIEHPRPPFLWRIWYRIKYFFIKPKFSSAAIEPAEPLKTNNNHENLEG